MSEDKPVSPDKYTLRPFVNVTTKPLASPTYAPSPLLDRFVFSGSTRKALESSFVCSAVTAVTVTPCVADARRIVRLAPIPRPAVHGVVRGTVISLVKPLAG